jgi:hypothetical protein
MFLVKENNEIRYGLNLKLLFIIKIGYDYLQRQRGEELKVTYLK